MNFELFFEICLIVLYSSFTIIRIHFSRLSRKVHKRGEIKESKIRLTILQVYIISTVIIFFLFIFIPSWFKWGMIKNYPFALRWVGLGLGIFSIALFSFVHIFLGRNFSYTLQLSDEHTLVTSGPYRFIRHPMYTAFILLHISIFLISQNWFIGIIWMCGLIIILLLRINKEEEMLIEVFSEKYIEYKRHTGALFFPVIKFLRKNNREEILSGFWKYHAIDSLMKLTEKEIEILQWFEPILNDFRVLEKTEPIQLSQKNNKKITKLNEKEFITQYNTEGLLKGYEFSLQFKIEQEKQIITIKATGEKDFVKKIRTSYETNIDYLENYRILYFGP